MLHDVEELRLINEAVDNLLVITFPFEGSKNPIPNDQDSGVILVQAITIRSWSQIQKKSKSTLGVIHKWRHAILDNFWHPLAPLPIVTRFITKALVLSLQNPWPPPPLRPWRHLLTTPYQIERTIMNDNIKKSSFVVLESFLNYI